jgi:hypothetical protein
MKIIRNEEQIKKEINRLLKDRSNFVTDNYGSEAADNGEYEESFDKYQTEITLNNFVKWLTKI